MSDSAGGPGPQPPEYAPLSGLSVLAVDPTLAAAFAAWFLADAGADVTVVEPPGGSPLRARAAWPVLARGQRSLVLDLEGPEAATDLHALLHSADVAVLSPDAATSARLALGPEDLTHRHPRLVAATITGWGSTGPWTTLKDHEPLVMAKLGYCHVKRKITTRPGPAFVSVPFASWGAAHAAVHGVLSALLEREDSGVGQAVESDLVRGAAAMDTWNWFTELVGARWPGAFQPVEAFDDQGRPQGPLIYPLLVAPTADAAWMQFAQVEPRLFRAMLAELGVLEQMADPHWAGMPAFPDVATRIAFWELLLEKTSSRSLAEWEDVFATNRDISAEVYRDGFGARRAFDHPQLVHDGRVVWAEDPERGPVRQPSTLIHVDGHPLRAPRPAPGLGGPPPAVPGTSHNHDHSVAAPAGSAGPAPVGRLPLAGVMVLELGLMYAAPYATTLLTDLGARVIKVEDLGGDAIRGIAGFPEAGGAKVMQGKESVAADITTPEGLALIHELARRADVVLQGFRAGVAQRLGVDADALRTINPGLVYLNAPGYGLDGPYGGRPAYAPSIGAASGLALAEAPDAADRTGSLEEVKATSARLNAASAVIPLQADGISAVGAASALLLGLLARRRGRALPPMTATMLGSTTHAVVENLVDWAGRPAAPSVDPGGWGFSALCRIYAAADGFIMLAAPAPREWPELVDALAPYVDLGADRRFASAAARGEHDPELTVVLAGVFAGGGRERWERELSAAGVGCVAVTEHDPERTLQSDPWFSAGYSVIADSPVFDEHRRLAPITRFSRSAVKADGGCLLGDHTETVLNELGYDTETIADLRRREIVG